MLHLIWFFLSSRSNQRAMLWLTTKPKRSPESYLEEVNPAVRYPDSLHGTVIDFFKIWQLSLQVIWSISMVRLSERHPGISHLKKYLVLYYFLITVLPSSSSLYYQTRRQSYKAFWDTWLLYPRHLHMTSKEAFSVDDYTAPCTLLGLKYLKWMMRMRPDWDGFANTHQRKMHIPS